MADETTTPAATFTQQQVDSIVANARREAEAKFADYAELKGKVDAAEAKEREAQTALEQLSGQVTKLTDSLAERDQQALRNQVALAKKLTPEQAEFLSGKTEAELSASADKVRTTFGIKDEAPAEGDEPVQPTTTTTTTGNQPHTRRPTDGLTAGGAPVTTGAPEETSPEKLADLLGR